MSLIADVRRITAEYMGKISAQQRLLKEHEKSRENFSEARFAEIERQLGLDMEAIKDECERKVRERVERYKAAISTADALNGSDLTDDAKLLNGDYPLTVNDLDAMIDRSAGNRTRNWQRPVGQADHHPDPAVLQQSPENWTNPAQEFS